MGTRFLRAALAAACLAGLHCGGPQPTAPVTPQPQPKKSVEKKTRAGEAPAPATGETAAEPAPKAAPAAGQDASTEVVAEREKNRAALLAKLGKAQRVWVHTAIEGSSDRCEELPVRSAAQKKYAAELMIAPEPGAKVVVLYRFAYPEVLLAGAVGVLTFAEVAEENPFHKGEGVGLGCCGSSKHEVIAVSDERADLAGLGEDDSTWSLYFSRAACEREKSAAIRRD